MNTACVVFLIEEAPSMQTRIAEGTHSRLESVATAINSAIRQMEGMPAIDVAIIGYHRNAEGLPVIGSRWNGAFAGKLWVSSDELATNPLRVETRTKHMVNPVTRAVTQMTVEFPVWFEPIQGAERLEYSLVYAFLAQMLTDWIQQTEPAVPPLIFSFLADLQPDDSIANAVIPLGQVSTPMGVPTLCQCHVGSYANVPAIKYPTVAHFLPYGPVQELFYACSPLTDFMFTALRQNQEFPSSGAKALVYNGRMIDVVRILGSLKFYQSTRPVRAPNAKFTVQKQEIQNPEIQSQEVRDSKVQVQNSSPQFSNVQGTEAQTSDFSLSAPNTEHSTPPITPCPPFQPKARHLLQMPGVIPQLGTADSLFEDFDHESDEDDSLSDIPSVENLPEVKAEIIPDGFDYHCRPFATNKSIPEPPNLPPRQALVVLLMDRSVSSLIYKPALETWEKRKDKIRFMLGEFARRGRGRYDVGIVSYGKERDGRMSADRDSLGRAFLPDNCLSETAGKVELTMIQIPNGIGGLISLPRKKLFFTDSTPTYPGDPVMGIRSAIEIIREWEATRQNKVLPPVIVHLTSGQFLTERLDEALELLSDPTLPPVNFLQWVFTERPHVGVCCPPDESFTQDETLKMLWERTSPLPAREFLAGVRPGIHEESRGMMVNMDFDVLFEVLDTMAKKVSE